MYMLFTFHMKSQKEDSVVEQNNSNDKNIHRIFMQITVKYRTPRYNDIQNSSVTVNMQMLIT